MFGYNNGIIKNVQLENLNIYSTVGDGGVYTGGVVAHNYGIVQNCSVDGTIKVIDDGVVAQYFYAGGVAGINTGTITNCYSQVEFDVKTDGEANVGGVAGANTNGGIIQNCYSSGNITAQGTYQTADIKTGGIVGHIESGQIKNCFATGDVSTASTYSYYGYVGGIVGKTNQTNCVLENNYRATEQSLVPTSPGTGVMVEINQEGTSISVSTIKTSNFIFNTLNWSSDVWEITNGNLPTLKVEV